MTRLRFAPLLALLGLFAGCDGCATDAAPPAENRTAPPAAFNDDKAVPPDPRESVLAKSVHSLLENEHLVHRPADDAISTEAFKAYLERLDGGKLFLLQADVDALARMSHDMDDQLKSGNLLIARQGEARLIARRKVVAGVVAELVQKAFDFDQEESVETDPDKTAFCKTEDELRERWRKELKLQVLQRVGAMESIEEARKKGDRDDDEDTPAPQEEIPADFKGKEAKARQEVATSYEARFKRFEDREPLDPADRFLGAITSVYDPHTTYLPPAEMENFDIEMSGSLEGIGALLGIKEHLVEVRELVPGGASWRQGDLEVGDLIMAVTSDGKTTDITDMSLDRVVSLIRGPKGTVVTLRVRHPDGGIEDVAITRDVIVVEAAYARGAKLKRQGEQVGYVLLPSFYGSTRQAPGASDERDAASDVGKLLAVFEGEGVPGVIIDLRGNGGGLLSHARGITGHLIDTGAVVQVRGPDDDNEVIADEDPGVVYRGNVVVLVDRFSASASEILAGALQDHERAVIVGTGPTHGKGTVQTLVELNRLHRDVDAPLGVLKLTIQQYFLPDGDSTQLRGVQPDVVLPDPASYVESGERFHDHAIPWSSVPPLPHKPWEASWDAKALAAQSGERVKKDPLFLAVETRNAKLDKKLDETLIPLSKAAWKARRDEVDAMLEEVKDMLGEGRQRFDVDPISYAPEAAADDERVKKKLDRWREELGRDPWVDEAISVLADMRSSQ